MITISEEIMRRLQRSGKNFLTFKPAEQGDLYIYVNILQRSDQPFDPDIVLDTKTRIKDLSIELASYLENHPVQRH